MDPFSSIRCRENEARIEYVSIDSAYLVLHEEEIGFLNHPEWRICFSFAPKVLEDLDMDHTHTVLCFRAKRFIAYHLKSKSPATIVPGYDQTPQFMWVRVRKRSGENNLEKYTIQSTGGK